MEYRPKAKAKSSADATTNCGNAPHTDAPGAAPHSHDGSPGVTPHGPGNQAPHVDAPGTAPHVDEKPPHVDTPGAAPHGHDNAALTDSDENFALDAGHDAPNSTAAGPTPISSPGGQLPPDCKLK